MKLNYTNSIDRLIYNKIFNHKKHLENDFKILHFFRNTQLVAVSGIFAARKFAVRKLAARNFRRNLVQIGRFYPYYVLYSEK